MLNIISIVLSMATILFLLYDRVLYRIEFCWNKTMWLERIIGIEIMFWNKEKTCATGRIFNWGKESENEFEVYRSKKKNSFL